LGFRYFYILDECREMVGWTENDKIAFATAALGVEMDIKTQ
jgi:microtubule-associated protein-like 6